MNECKANFENNLIISEIISKRKIITIDILNDFNSKLNDINFEECNFNNLTSNLQQQQEFPKTNNNIIISSVVENSISSDINQLNE